MGKPPRVAIYRSSKSHVWVGLFGMALFGLLSAGAASGILTDVLKPNATSDLGLKSLVLIIVLTFFSLFARVAASALRHRLEFDGERVRVRGLFRWREVRLDEVNLVQWSTSGSLMLRTDRGARLRLEFLRYTRPQRNRLIERLRSVIRGETQVGWEPFDATSPRRTIDLEKLRTEDRLLNREVQRPIAVAGTTCFLILLLSFTWIRFVWGVAEVPWSSLFQAATMPLGMYGVMWLTSRVTLAMAREDQKDPGDAG